MTEKEDFSRLERIEQNLLLKVVSLIDRTKLTPADKERLMRALQPGDDLREESTVHRYKDISLSSVERAVIRQKYMAEGRKVPDNLLN